MIIKTLEIRNIASIEETTIDFSGDVLGGAPIFLICGETGAGKSTILDAICLALYGETPRMASVAKEEIEMYEAGEKNKSYTNDNSQLLRRGSGEGWVTLTFTGNDGVDYEARWHIHRAHNKPHKKLQDCQRRLRAIDGSYEENRLKEIDIKIVEVTGLEYSQFCRTVMLAQGEFTKFLKSKPSEKSEILEKLTGTEIYSKIGSRIAERFNMLRSDWEEKKRRLDAVHLLTDEERTALVAQRDAMNQRAAELQKEREVAVAKINWLLFNEKLQENRKKTLEKLDKLKERVAEETFVAECREVEDYENTSEGRLQLKEIRTIESLLAKHQLLLPEHQSRMMKSREDRKKQEASYTTLSKELEVQEGALEKYDREKLIKDSKLYSERDKLLADIQTRHKEIAGERKRLDDHRAQLNSLEDSLKECVGTIESLTEPLEASLALKERLTKELEGMEMSMDRKVKELRAQLKVGDICPVCGEKVMTLVNDEFFVSLLQPRRDEKVRAEEEYLKLLAQHTAAVSSKAKTETDLKHVTKQLGEITANVAKLEEEVEMLVVKAGYMGLALDAALVKVADERSMIEEKLKDVHQLQTEAEAKNKEVTRLRKKVRTEQDKFTKAKDVEKECETALELWRTGKEAHESRLTEHRESLNRFLEEHLELTYGRLEQLSLMKPDKMKKRRAEIDKTLSDKRDIEVKCATIDEQIEEQERKRPEFAEDENMESLTAAKGGMDAEIDALNQNVGNLNLQLTQDEERRESMEAERREVEKARGKMERWEGLYRLLGDASGTRFRAVAQSFILESLLENANQYMRSFTDRYLLTCNSGTLAILVKDNHKPSEPQPASILSGGESFMASLSLALALSNLRSGGNGVDVLFIDEGFGTLSPDVLGNVMDTLEKLHQIGGRKVGLISHVPEMRERIPVHISVCRESPALSRVHIHTTY